MCELVFVAFFGGLPKTAAELGSLKFMSPLVHMKTRSFPMPGDEL